MPESLGSGHLASLCFFFSLEGSVEGSIRALIFFLFPFSQGHGHLASRLFSCFFVSLELLFLILYHLASLDHAIGHEARVKGTMHPLQRHDLPAHIR